MAEQRPKEGPTPPSRRPSVGPTLLAGVCAVALVVLGLAWSLASPPGSSPDDDFHLASIWCATGDPTMCRRTGAEIEGGIERVQVIPALGAGLICFAHAPRMSAACQTAARREGAPGVSRANDGLYPGGFYRAMSLFATTNVDRSVVVMRMASWVVALSLLLAAGLLARRAERPALALAALTTLVPMGVYLFASTNPSGVAIAGIVAYWIAAVTLLEGPGSSARRAMVVAVMLVGSAVALVSRSDAGLYLAVAGLAAWLSVAGYRTPFRRWSLLVAGIACLGIVATLLGRQNERWAGGLGVQEDQTRTALLFEGMLDLPRRVLGSIGLSELGWLDTPMPAIVGTLMLFAFGGALAIGLGVATREKWLALAVVAGTLVGLPLLVLSSGQNVQPRYVLPLLPILMGTALITRRVDPPVRFRRVHALLIVLAVVVAHGAALHSNIRRYVTGVDVGGPDLGASVEWWWSRGPGPMATWALGTVAFGVVAACVYGLLAGGPSSRTR
jgi:hypothetical protein